MLAPVGLRRGYCVDGSAARFTGKSSAEMQPFIWELPKNIGTTIKANWPKSRNRWKEKYETEVFFFISDASSLLTDSGFSVLYLE